MDNKSNEKHDARLVAERQIIPNFFYMNGAGMLNSILDRQGELFTSLYSMADSANTLDFSAEDFKIEPRGFRSGDYSIYLIIADTPKPLEPDECRRIYFFYEETTGLLRCYASCEAADGKYCLCSCPPNGAHKKLDGTFGKTEQDKEKEFIAAAREFLKHFKIEE